MRQRTLAQARGALAALTTPSSSPKPPTLALTPALARTLALTLALTLTLTLTLTLP